MGNVTSDLLIWTPDQDDLGDPDIYLATMAQSIEDGTGERLRKQEAFVGCTLGLASVFSVNSSSALQVPFAVTGAAAFNMGMTISGGTVTVPMDGIYLVNVVANYLSASTTAPRVNTYLYLGSSAVLFESAYGSTSTSRYVSTNLNVPLKLVAGNTLAVRTSIGDSNANLQAGGGSSFSVSLLKPL